MKLQKLIIATVVSGLLVNLAACGTILNPERKGQSAGRIDPAIAVLDGIGLLFFIIPGVIAFAVDFNNGTIYLPGGRRSSLEPDSVPQAIQATQTIDAAYLEAVLHDRAGVDVRIDSPVVSALEMSSLDEAFGQIQHFERSLNAEMAQAKTAPRVRAAKS